MQRVVSAYAMFFCGLFAYAQSPPWLEVFRDAVYGQNVSVGAAERMYNDAQKQARESLTGFALHAALSRCEYLLGKVYQDHNLNNEAASRYEAGISLAEQSLAENPNADAYEMIASHYGQLCMIKSNAWVMANGLKVEDNAKKALQLDGENAGAMYLLASRWAFGPGIFGNPKRGITELQAILDSRANMQKDNFFNVYSAMAYAHSRLNQNREALTWIEKALSIYPTNKFALDMQTQIVRQSGKKR